MRFLDAIRGAPPGCIPFETSPFVPLTRTDPDTGEVSDVACITVAGRLLFHPQRIAEIRSEIAQRDRELARWSDDGGAR